MYLLLCLLFFDYAPRPCTLAQLIKGTLGPKLVRGYTTTVYLSVILKPLTAFRILTVREPEVAQ